jgi:hypothetical protein
MHLIWVRPERKYFLKRGWTGQLAKHELICPSGKLVGLSAVARTAKAEGVAHLFIAGKRRITYGR